MARQMDERIIGKATLAQQQAANPNMSVWVSANAGTGKTKVLVDRLLRLMIAEPATKPTEILGLTFSKAGASEMLNKLQEKLGELSALSAAVLAQELEEKILLRTPTKTEVQRAKQMYDQVLDSPPQLMTIHSFCHGILKRFPLEVGIFPQFILLEEEAANETLQQAMEQTFTEIADPQHLQHAAYQHVMRYVAEQNVRTVLQKTLAQRARLQRLLHKANGVDNYINKLGDILEVNPELAKQPLVENMERYVPDSKTQRLLEESVAALLGGGKKAKERGEKLQAYVQLPNSEQKQKVENYINLFLTSKGQALSSLTDKKVQESNPEVESLLRAEQGRIMGLKKEWYSQQTFCHTAAILQVASAVLDNYTALKKKKNGLDFEDLIQYTLELLSNADVKDWVGYRLDQNIKHIMLDEGQDTNQRQWEILQTLVEEFFSGSDQHEEKRTFFAVGDIKQSIYRFQEAEPRVFQQILTQMQKWDATGTQVREVALETSFRTNPAILQAVDLIFSEGEKAESLTDTTQKVEHASAYTNHHASIQVWPLVAKNKVKKQEDIPWQLPVYEPTEENATWQVAERVAKSMNTLANSSQRLSDGKRIDYGDMMILLRSRKMLPMLLKKLQEHGVPVVVTGGNKKENHPIVDDLLALCRVLINPLDDLSLAQVLKSPLFNKTDDLLINLAEKRQKEEPLWDVLEQIQPDIYAQLEKWRTGAQKQTVYQVCMQVLQQTKARGAFITRFGGSSGSKSARQAVQSVIDGFLETALKHTGGWHKFIYTVENKGISIAAASGESSDAVRVMTVHGSKGLEAPIVFLPDTTGNYTKRQQDDKWLWDEEELILYSLPKEQATPLQQKLLDAEEKRMIQDEQRLLYVALTRAKERLYIGGALAGNTKEAPENSWYADIQSIVSTENGWLQQEDESWVYENGSVTATPEQPTQQSFEENIPPPAWLNQPAKQSYTIKQPTNEDTENEEIRKRGEDIHKLLEVLPRYDERQWQMLTKHLLPNWQENERNTAIQCVQKVVQQHPWLFSKTSKAEVAIQTKKGQKRIDRLVVDNTSKNIQIIDFKTVSEIPNTIPSKYMNQLTEYAVTIGEIYPNYKVQAGVLWVPYPTEKSRLDWVDLTP
ncbi:MAG: UvrD-helicase domain-containing protein [Alphaproteobacteria bacterium]|nr:UvrD-helicase domain-containing protein [Alphaproteobacteria bacterium]MDD9919597.1 UvrD-helicase domain-containing protein [Alphaproteobacteria bacterium]